MSILDRLENMRIHYKLSKGEFEKVIDKSSGYINALRKKNGIPGSDVLIKISSEYPEINTEWLLLGQGSMLKSEIDQVSEKSEGYPNDSIALVRSDIKMLSDALYQPLKDINDGVFKMLLDQQKVLRFIDNIDLDSYNQIGSSLREFLKEK